jgi:hypothetical protein
MHCTMRQILLFTWLFFTVGQHIVAEALPLVAYDNATEVHCVDKAGLQTEPSNDAPFETEHEGLHHHHCPTAIHPSVASTGGVIAIKPIKQQPHRQRPMLSRSLAPPLDPPLA